MPLPSNSRLGPYEIKSQLGAGGMGEVYRARDSRLNRDVAIKILRVDGVGSADLRIRFEREARAVAALNHPNIVAVYDFGVEQDQQYIVSELIEGESLRSLLRGKSVASRKLVDIATQIADGLAAAHSAGIVHRDLKPENIMIAKDGRVKILDFGLARQARASGILVAGVEDATLTEMPEAHRNITGAGAVMGTPNYMSPEQALGRELDYRSDQFSFGLIVYELASGKQAFTKASSIETMAAIVREEPAPMDEKLPPPLRWIIDRCLAKEPEQRYESTRDLYRDLKNLRDHFSEAYASGAFPQTAAVVAKPSYKKFAAICLACIVLGALLVYVLKPSGQNVGDLHYTPFASNAKGGAWSPDGKSVAYSGGSGGISQVFLKRVDSTSPVQLTRERIPTRARGWSADGNHVIVEESDDKGTINKIYSVPVVGGDPEFIMDVTNVTSTMSGDGKAFAIYRKGSDNLFSVEISDPIGSPFVPYKPAPFAGKQFFNTPELKFSPNGKNILLSQQGDGNKLTFWLLPYPAGSGTPHVVLSRVANIAIEPTISWMQDSRHVVVSFSIDPRTPDHLWMADTQSNDLTLLTNGIADEVWPRLSPDGESLLYTNMSFSLDVISLSVLDGSSKTVITTGRMESMPDWSAKQEEFVWVSNRGAAPAIWLRLRDGSERPVVTSQDLPGVDFMNPALSPSGDRLIFSTIDSAGAMHLWISAITGTHPIRLTNAVSDMEFGGSWSPDGSKFIYRQSNEGQVELMLVKTSGGAAPTVLKATVCGLPNWSPLGKLCISSATSS